MKMSMKISGQEFNPFYLEMCAQFYNADFQLFYFGPGSFIPWNAFLTSESISARSQMPPLQAPILYENIGEACGWMRGGDYLQIFIAEGQWNGRMHQPRLCGLVSKSALGLIAIHTCIFALAMLTFTYGENKKELSHFLQRNVLWKFKCCK